MNSMLKDILDAEKKARESQKQAESYIAEVKENIRQEMNQILTDRIQDAQNEIERMQQEHKAAVDKSLASSEQAAKNSKIELEKKERECMESWVNELFIKTITNT